MEIVADHSVELKENLKEIFGYNSFRGKQEVILTISWEVEIPS